MKLFIKYNKIAFIILTLSKSYFTYSQVGVICKITHSMDSIKLKTGDSLTSTELQVIDNHDSIRYYWPSILGNVQLKRVNSSKYEINCYTSFPELIDDSITHRNIKVCQVSLNNKNCIIQKRCNLAMKYSEPEIHSIFDSLFSLSKDFNDTSFLSIELQYSYYKLYEMLAMNSIHGSLISLRRLDTFFTDFKFMNFSALNLEIVILKNLVTTLNHYD